MEDQHASLHDDIETSRRVLAAWTSSPTQAGGHSLATALSAIADQLSEHLAEEERDIVPLIAAHVSEAEWEAFGKHAFNKFKPKQRFTAMGEMLAAATPAEAARCSLSFRPRSGSSGVVRSTLLRAIHDPRARHGPLGGWRRHITSRIGRRTLTDRVERLGVGQLDPARSAQLVRIVGRRAAVATLYASAETRPHIDSMGGKNGQAPDSRAAAGPNRLPGTGPVCVARRRRPAVARTGASRAEVARGRYRAADILGRR